MCDDCMTSSGFMMCQDCGCCLPFNLYDHQNDFTCFCGGSFCGCHNCHLDALYLLSGGRDVLQTDFLPHVDLAKWTPYGFKY